MVTVVFCDVVGSTVLGESHDPEAIELLLARYFGRMSEILERHGGTVEKFIGDAVVAVFGVPIAHEDDAVRALRAAVEMRDALPGLEVEARIGVNSGEIVTSGHGHGTIITGDAVNVAARLQQAGSSGAILIGATTRLLAQDAIEAHELAPLVLKGKVEPVAAFELLRVREARDRPHLARFVGRHEELARLAGAWQRAVEGNRCELVAIVGEAGIGKSRLVAEFLDHVPVRSVRGRCLSYGERITYFPVVEVIKQLEASPSDPAVAAAIGSLLGESAAWTSPEEISWAFRQLLEAAAPLVVVFDDIQWGEETFLRLVRDVVALSTDSALLVVCLARPEFSDDHPTWPVAISLAPLAETDVEKLLPPTLATALREQIVRAAGGNPLFVTEMTAVAAETDAAQRVVVPPTLRGLLAARLDQLAAAERSVLEAGAIEGELFHVAAAEWLCPADVDVTSTLETLIEKDLVRPVATTRAETGYLFHHVLIRDAAYDAIPKTRRAVLHERLADWLVEHDADMIEADEIVGHHLEQAFLYLTQLGRSDPAAEVLAERAADALAAAGGRAVARGNMAAAAGLLDRAATLLDETSPRRPELLLSLAGALRETGAFAAARAALDELERFAGADPRLLAHAAIDRGLLRIYSDHTIVPGDLSVIADAAIATLAPLGDERGLAKALHLSGVVSMVSCRFAEAELKFEPALAYARRSGDRELKRAIANLLATATVLGPRPVAGGKRHLTALHESETDDRLLAGRLLTAIAYLHALAGQFDEARALRDESQGVMRDLGARVAAAFMRMWSGGIELLAGDAVAAEDEFRAGLDTLEQLGETGVSPTLRALLAAALLEQGRRDEAAAQARHTTHAISAGDILTEVLVRIVGSRIAASSAEPGEAVRLAQEAVELTAGTDALALRAEALLALARVTSSAPIADEAYSLFDEKGSLPGMRLARMTAVRARAAATL